PTLPAGYDPSYTDDGAPDVMDGGDGDDAILSGDGDTVTGGAGADAFSHIGLGEAVATFTDFDPAEDMFVVEWTDSDAPDPMLVLTDNADGSQTLSANGTDLAVFAQGGVRMED
ncbi:hypothetical protein AB9K41_27170, partial [Cribrihabitans sp. XS_ASV171]